MTEAQSGSRAISIEHATGYAHPGYARSLSEFGRPRVLVESGTSVLERPIPGLADRDAMGCYPLFVCRDWSKLELDLGALGRELVCLSVVTDPFGRYDRACLERAFPDVARPFKQHYVLDLPAGPGDFISPHHLRNARRAERVLRVEPCKEPTRLLPTWTELYANLVTRHQITGVPAFSASSFALQLALPGLLAYRAIYRDRTCGMLLFFVHDEVAYYHLGAYSDEGYELRASFALFRHAIEDLRARGLRWLSLGAGAGVDAGATDGLSRFKQGWASGTRTAWFCGRVFDRERYRAILSEKHVSEGAFFPAYRRQEWRK